MTTMDFREKMVQLLKDIMPLFTFEEQVDHLIANGVIVPPCEIGADVWYLSGDVKNGWETLKPTHAEKVSGGFNLKMLNSITGKLAPWYFLTKEEAEKALERS